MLYRNGSSRHSIKASGGSSSQGDCGTISRGTDPSSILIPLLLLLLLLHSCCRLTKAVAVGAAVNTSGTTAVADGAIGTADTVLTSGAARSTTGTTAVAVGAAVNTSGTTAVADGAIGTAAGTAEATCTVSTAGTAVTAGAVSTGGTAVAIVSLLVAASTTTVASTSSSFVDARMIEHLMHTLDFMLQPLRRTPLSDCLIQ